MNNDKLKGGLKQAEGSVKKALGEITNDKSKKAEGSVDKLVGAAPKERRRGQRRYQKSDQVRSGPS